MARSRRRMVFIPRIVVAALVMVVSSVVVAVPPSRGIVPWMCLERCPGTSHNDVLRHIKTLAEHRDVISAVAFERFNLGPNSTLEFDDNLTHVAPLLRAAGFTTVAMVSSWPYPKAFLEWMRHLFRQPFPFMKALVGALINEDIDGVNIDFEPTAEATADDARHYATFLGVLRNELSLVNKTLSVDVARWSVLWNYTALSEAMVQPTALGLLGGYVATMNTYVSEDAAFAAEAKYAVMNVAGEALLLGIEDWPQLTLDNVTYRFDLMRGLGVMQVGIWRVPIPHFWWPVIQAFVNGSE